MQAIESSALNLLLKLSCWKFPKNESRKQDAQHIGVQIPNVRGTIRCEKLMRLIANCIKRCEEHSAQERVLRQIRHSRLMSQRMKQGKREDKVNRYVNEFIM